MYWKILFPSHQLTLWATDFSGKTGRKGAACAKPAPSWQEGAKEASMPYLLCLSFIQQDLTICPKVVNVSTLKYLRLVVLLKMDGAGRNDHYQTQ